MTIESDLVLGRLETFSKTCGFYPSPESELMYKLMEVSDDKNRRYRISLDKIKIGLGQLKEEQQKHVIENIKGLEDTNIPTCLVNPIIGYIFYEFKEDNVNKSKNENVF